MHPHEALIKKFYGAFSVKDADAMGACYHDEAQFSDPAFPNLDAGGVRAMWAMLTSRAGDDFSVELMSSSADDDGGTAQWDAHYTFTTTGRKVHNRVTATLEFRDGLIVRHTDVFDFHRWSKQALGAPGLLLGWTSFLKNKVQTTAGGQLESFRKKRGI